MLTLNFNPFPILTSERLRFRRLTDSDANEVFELRSNPETMKYIPRPLTKTINDVLSHIGARKIVFKYSILKRQYLSYGIE